MYCPKCRAEYRDGFTRCSDCDVQLVDALAPPHPESAEAAENERPGLASTRHFLAWFLPMTVYATLVFAFSVRPLILHNLIVLLFFVCLHMSAVLGAFWMLYQAVRYERRVLRYALLAGVPFMFVWYSLVRVPLRRELKGDSPFIR